jgi:hypothetical protein
LNYEFSFAFFDGLILMMDCVSVGTEHERAKREEGRKLSESSAKRPLHFPLLHFIEEMGGEVFIIFPRSPEGLVKSQSR